GFRRSDSSRSPARSSRKWPGPVTLHSKRQLQSSKPGSDNRTRKSKFAMKLKHLLILAGVLVTAAGLRLSRAACRGHRQTVSLNVRTAPLAEVLRRLERQTWQKLPSERALDARITLDVTDKPLPDVLDRIAEQAGARWTTVHAVYNSGRALRKL